MKKQNYLLLLLLFSVTNLFSQEKIIIGTSRDNPDEVMVKWFTENLLAYDGFRIYRAEKGKEDYILLNPVVVKKGATVPAAIEFKNDSTLRDYIKLADAISAENFRGFVKISLFIKAVLSNDFARYLGMMYVDTTCSAGASYFYKVTGVQGGKEIQIGNPQEIISGKPPEVMFPKEVQLSQEEKAVNIKWRPEEEKYFAADIYRSVNQSPFKKINALPVIVSKVKNVNGELVYPPLFYSDSTGFCNGDSVCYRLVCIDYFGNTVGAGSIDFLRDSAVCTEVYKSASNLGKITILSEQYAHLSATVSWQFSGEKFSGYEFLVSENGSGYKVFKSGDASLFNRIDTLKFEKPGKYYFKIRVRFEKRGEVYSFPRILDIRDTREPLSPLSLSAGTENSSVILSWGANTESDLAGYHVYRGTSVSGKLIRQTVKPLKESRYTDKLRAGMKTTMVYSVSAVDSSFNESKLSDTVAVRLPDKIAPPEPVITQVKAEKEGVGVRWLGDRTGQTAGYYVRRTDEEGRKVLLNKNAVGAGETVFTDKSARPGKKYEYQVSAVDSAGNESGPSVPWGIIFL